MLATTKQTCMYACAIVELPVGKPGKLEYVVYRTKCLGLDRANTSDGANARTGG